MSLVTKTFSWKTIYENLSRKPFTKTFNENLLRKIYKMRTKY